jgi:hypothetical protein
MQPLRYHEFRPLQCEYWVHICSFGDRPLWPPRMQSAAMGPSGVARIGS